MRDVVFFCCYFILPPRMQSWRWTISTSGQFAYALLAQETVVCLVGPFTSPDVDAAMAAMGTEPDPFPKRASDAPSAPLFHLQHEALHVLLHLPFFLEVQFFGGLISLFS